MYPNPTAQYVCAVLYCDIPTCSTVQYVQCYAMLSIPSPYNMYCTVLCCTCCAAITCSTRIVQYVQYYVMALCYPNLFYSIVVLCHAIRTPSPRTVCSEQYYVVLP
jgi:hypothetical protein